MIARAVCCFFLLFYTKFKEKEKKIQCDDYYFFFYMYVCVYFFSLSFFLSFSGSIFFSFLLRFDLRRRPARGCAAAQLFFLLLVLCVWALSDDEALSLSVLHLISFSLSPFFQVPLLKIDFEEIKIWEKMGNHFFRCFFLCFVCRVSPSEQIRRAIKNHLLRPVVHCAEHVETRTVVVFFSLDIGDGHVYKKYIWLAPCRTERRNIKPRAS